MALLIKLPKEIHIKLKKHCIDLQISMSNFVENIIMDALDEKIKSTIKKPIIDEATTRTYYVDEDDNDLPL
jgi:hypothetical protein